MTSTERPSRTETAMHWLILYMLIPPIVILPNLAHGDHFAAALLSAITNLYSKTQRGSKKRLSAFYGPELSGLNGQYRG